MKDRLKGGPGSGNWGHEGARIVWGDMKDRLKGGPGSGNWGHEGAREGVYGKTWRKVPILTGFPDWVTEEDKAFFREQFPYANPYDRGIFRMLELVHRGCGLTGFITAYFIADDFSEHHLLVYYLMWVNRISCAKADLWAESYRQLHRLCGCG